MLFPIAAALALTTDATPNVAGSPLASNLEYASPVVGNWAYAATNDGSEATFTNASGQPQLTIRCTRSNRRIALLKPGAAAPAMWVWTSSLKKSLPASYDATAARVIAELAPFDPLLDAMAFSRGRIGFSTSGLAALVVPPWADVARVIEDCRV
ncbi:MAG TPA: hypothetical protein VFK28_09585 [Sphingomicrobium sp.]|nr:hypothetical protein [Sphingomicrobium sp.]